MIPLCEQKEKQHVVELHGTINAKGIFTLNDNANNYDEIRIYATNNYWDNYLVCNTYKYLLNDSYFQTLQYSFGGVYDGALKIYNNKIDTSACENIGTNNCHIYSIEGIKY